MTVIARVSSLNMVESIIKKLETSGTDAGLRASAKSSTHSFEQAENWKVFSLSRVKSASKDICRLTKRREMAIEISAEGGQLKQVSEESVDRHLVCLEHLHFVDSFWFREMMRNTSPQMW